MEVEEATWRNRKGAGFLSYLKDIPKPGKENRESVRPRVAASNPVFQLYTEKAVKKEFEQLHEVSRKRQNQRQAHKDFRVQHMVL